MNRAIMQRTQVNVTLTLQTDNQTLELFLLLILAALWLSRRAVNRARYEVAMTWQDFKQAAAFTAKVFTIGFNSWAWALGARL